MHVNSARRRLASLAVLTLLPAALSMSASLSASARAATLASISPSLHPDKLGAHSSLTVTIHYSSDGSGAPLPLRHATISFPAGMSVEVPQLRACAIARLRALGAAGCSALAQLGSGYATAEVPAGSQLISEHIRLWAFLGPPQNLEPTVELLGQGYTPFDERLVFSGVVAPANPPYGEQISMSIPPIASIPLEPDASITAFSLTVGTRRAHGQSADSILVPTSCPLGGFPFAAAFTYAGGSSGETTASVPCPSQSANGRK